MKQHSLLPFALLPLLVASLAHAESGLVLWNTLGSDAEVTNSLVGPDLELYNYASHGGTDCCDATSSQSYVAGPATAFGKGLTLAGNYGVTQRIHNVVLDNAPSYIDPEKGTIEAWYKQSEDPIAYVHNPHRIFDGAYGFGVGLGFLNQVDHYGGDGLTASLQFGGSYVTVFADISAFDGSWVHVAMAWDRAGIAGSSDTLRLYVNGQTVASSTDASWGTTVGPLADVGGANDAAGYFSIDNLKIWDHARTDFSDRLQWAPGCMSFQRGLGGSVGDAVLLSDPARSSTNFGSRPVLAAGPLGQGVAKTLLGFDVSALPASAIVSNATVWLYQRNANPGVIEVHAATSPWTEGTVTHDSFANGYSSVAEATFLSGMSSKVSFDVTALAQGWHDGSVANYGMVLVESSGARADFASSESSSPAEQPVLNLCFSEIPHERTVHSLAYDSARSELVLFGGLNAFFGGDLGDTWTWDGLAWTQKSPAVTPGFRRNVHTAYDSARGVTVLFGGVTASTPLGDTWEWDGTTWSPRPSAHAPSPRLYSALAYDSARGVTVLFGGNGTTGGTPKFDETWEWDGIDWTQRSPAAAPSARDTTMAYDSARGVTVLYGGYDGALKGDTWEWDGTSWTLRTPTDPEGDGDPLPTQAPSLAHDSARGVTVLFGGSIVPPGSGKVYSGETWEWNGTSWRHAVPTDPEGDGNPSPRWGEIAYDTARGTVVLFGGSGNSGVKNDTWEWNGTSWALWP